MCSLPRSGAAGAAGRHLLPQHWRPHVVGAGADPAGAAVRVAEPAAARAAGHGADARLPAGASARNLPQDMCWNS